jgi:hypothetical protein
MPAFPKPAQEASTDTGSWPSCLDLESQQSPKRKLGHTRSAQNKAIPGLPSAAARSGSDDSTGNRTKSLLRVPTQMKSMLLPGAEDSCIQLATQCPHSHVIGFKSLKCPKAPTPSMSSSPHVWHHHPSRCSYPKS